MQPNPNGELTHSDFNRKPRLLRSLVFRKPSEWCIPSPHITISNTTIRCQRCKYTVLYSEKDSLSATYWWATLSIPILIQPAVGNYIWLQHGPWFMLASIVVETTYRWRIDIKYPHRKYQEYGWKRSQGVGEDFGESLDRKEDSKPVHLT